NKFEKTNGFCTDIFFDQATKWMGSQKGKKPFFAYISTNAPHGPFIAPDSYKKKFTDAGLKGNTVGFYGMIENIDDNLGRLIKQLEAWEIERETLVIFITDNGPAASNYNGEHKGKKNSVDEGGTRVPSFWRWPGVLQAGTDIDRISNHYDLLPTLAEIVGGNPEQADQLHGRSLVPLIKNPETPWKDRYRVFHKGRWGKDQAESSRDQGFAVRNQKFRLVGRDTLYDMENDPSQTKNVIDQYPKVAEAMNAHYDQWFDAALPNMVNEDAPLEGHNSFHLLYWNQYNLPVPPLRKKNK
ncbi:MAG: sulfatase-like hydrolase/transferase, partial [Planctomycetota bacterium]|nr:sulfatase-like hydrolase/transferase [Planctomycetota bacterium]